MAKYSSDIVINQNPNDQWRQSGDFFQTPDNIIRTYHDLNLRPQNFRVSDTCLCHYATQPPKHYII